MPHHKPLPPHHARYLYSPGQSLSEYVLPVALVGIVAVVGMSQLGGTLQFLLNGSMQNTFGTSTSKIAGVPQQGGPDTSFRRPFPELPGQQVTLKLGDGRVLNLNMADPMAVADAAGGNGVTENALAVLNQIVEQLRVDNPDDPMADELAKLAEKGHVIKEIQKMVQAKMPPGGFKDDNEKFAYFTDPKNSITYDGETMTLLESMKYLNPTYTTACSASKTACDLTNYYANYLQLYNNGPSDVSMVNAIASLYTPNIIKYQNQDPSILEGLPAFLAQLSQVEKQGYLRDPALKKLIEEDLSRQIYGASSLTLRSSNTHEVTGLVQTTRTNANNICSTSRTVTCQDRSS